MGTEIERKFLVQGDAWKRAAEGPGEPVRQGYLSTAREHTVRVRVKAGKGYITIKGESAGARRAEFEYPIPSEDATTMLDSLCQRPLIEKTRYVVRHRGCCFEVDEFHGDNAGLFVAEVELSSEDHEVELPEWIGKEVTDDPRYYNSNLVRHPYAHWHTKP